jgi:hypothetical protein
MRRSSGRRARLDNRISYIPGYFLQSIPKIGTILRPKAAPPTPRNHRRHQPLLLEVPKAEVSFCPRPPDSASSGAAPRNVGNVLSVPEGILADIELGKCTKKICKICNKHLGLKPISFLTCGCSTHTECISNFRKNKNIRNCVCPECRERYRCISLDPSELYQRIAAILIQRIFRGYQVRRHMGNYLPSGSIMHRNWMLSRAQMASALLVETMESQNDIVDAILVSIDKELDWARSIMKAVDVQQKSIDWIGIGARVFEKDGPGICAVCLRDIAIWDSVVTSCEHCFHNGCLTEWMRCCHVSNHAALCPVCRSAFQFRPGKQCCLLDHYV